MENASKIVNFVPSWLVAYRKEWLRFDIVAGLTTAAVVIPKAMAYATIAGLPVQVGLYTAFLPMVIYAVLGTSRALSVTTTTTIAILTAAELAEVVPAGDPGQLLVASAALTLLVGAILILASVLRLGFVANFISEPVLIGFKAGIGLVIVLDQVPKILGVHFPRGTFLQNLLSTVHEVPHASGVTLAVGVATIVVLVVLQRISHKFPASLIAVVGGVIGAYLLSLNTRGVDLVGYIPQGLPSLILPNLSLIAQLWPGALGIALMSFTETIAVGRAFAAKDEPPPQPNRELFATGVANAGGALLGAMPGGGGTSQTAVNRLAGARTQVSELVTAAISLITMLFLAPFLSYMPQATLAAVVVVYSVGLIKPFEFREILAVRRTEFTWAVIALFGVVVVGTLRGILVAIIVSLVALAYQVADPPVYALARKPGTNVFRPRSKEHPDDETFPELLLIRVDGRIFFANAEHLAQKMRVLVEKERPKVVALDFSGVIDLEYTALKMLIEAERRQRERGVRVWLAAMNPKVLAMIQKSPLGETPGRDYMFFNVEVAVSRYLALKASAAART